MSTSAKCVGAYLCPEIHVTLIVCLQLRTWSAITAVAAAGQLSLLLNHHYQSTEGTCSTRHYAWCHEIWWWCRGAQILAHVAQWLKHSGAVCSRAWCTHWLGSHLSPGTSVYQRIISNDFYAHDEQGENSGQEKEGSTVSCINCDHCWCLD